MSTCIFGFSLHTHHVLVQSLNNSHDQVYIKTLLSPEDFQGPNSGLGTRSNPELGYPQGELQVAIMPKETRRTANDQPVPTGTKSGVETIRMSLCPSRRDSKVIQKGLFPGMLYHSILHNVQTRIQYPRPFTQSCPSSHSSPRSSLRTPTTTAQTQTAQSTWSSQSAALRPPRAARMMSHLRRAQETSRSEARA